MLNCLKAGIIYADTITTVSPRYAREITTEQFGCALDGVLRARGDALVGILNGVDYSEWSPAKDKHIVRQYSPENLEGKKECKYDLLRQFGMENVSIDLPVIGIVSSVSMPPTMSSGYCTPMT